MSYKIEVTANFLKELKPLSKKYPSLKNDLLRLNEELLNNPFSGNELGKNCYKVRLKISSKGKGKSGGARVITCVKIIHEKIFLLSIYDKSELDNISDNRLIQILREAGLK